MNRFTYTLFAALLALPTFYEATIANNNYSNTLKLLETSKPEKITFCWDIHDTLLKQHKHQKFNSAIERDFLLSCLPEAHDIYIDLQKKYGFCAAEHMENALQDLAQKYLDKAAKASKSGNHAKARKYRKKAKRALKLIKTFHSFELSYTYQDGIMPFLENLKASGYTDHRVASNIAPRHFGLVKDKFGEIFNDAFIKDGLIIDVYKNPEIKKPHPDYYAKMQKTFNPQGDRILVFIDDKKANVDAACNAGIIGVQITDVDQLTNDLNKLGFKIGASSAPSSKNPNITLPQKSTQIA